MAGVVLVLRWAKFRRRLWQGSLLGWAVIAMLAALMVSVVGSIKPAFSFTIWLQLLGLLLLIALLPRLLAGDPNVLGWTLRILLTASVLGTAIAVIAIYIWHPLLSYLRPVDTPTAYHSALRLKSCGAVTPCLAPSCCGRGFV